LKCVTCVEAAIQTVLKVGKDGIEAGTNLVPVSYSFFPFIMIWDWVWECLFDDLS